MLEAAVLWYVFLTLEIWRRNMPNLRCGFQRKAWLPHFENVNVIIFRESIYTLVNSIQAYIGQVAPVSVFDQRLEEDDKVNRLEDSINLWTALCGSKLLSRTQLILFLNKCDLLKRKLKRGTRLNQHIPSYGNRDNDVVTAVKCTSYEDAHDFSHSRPCLDFREKFKEILREHSPMQRSTYIYATTATVSPLLDGSLEHNY